MEVGKFSMAELMAFHIDKILRKGGTRGLNINSIDELIEQQVKLFSYLLDKDLYIEAYKNYLAKRLLDD